MHHSALVNKPKIKHKTGHKTETKIEIKNLTFMVILRDLISMVVCVVVVIFKRPHTQGCIHKDKHPEETPDPECTHNECLKVLCMCMYVCYNAGKIIVKVFRNTQSSFPVLFC